MSRDQRQAEADAEEDQLDQEQIWELERKIGELKENIEVSLEIGNSDSHLICENDRQIKQMERQIDDIETKRFIRDMPKRDRNGMSFEEFVKEDSRNRKNFRESEELLKT